MKIYIKTNNCKLAYLLCLGLITFACTTPKKIEQINKKADPWEIQFQKDLANTKNSFAKLKETNNIISPKIIKINYLKDDKLIYQTIIEIYFLKQSGRLYDKIKITGKDHINKIKIMHKGGLGWFANISTLKHLGELKNNYAKSIASDLGKEISGSYQNCKKFLNFDIGQMFDEQFKVDIPKINNNFDCNKTRSDIFKKYNLTITYNSKWKSAPGKQRQITKTITIPMNKQASHNFNIELK